MGIRQITGWAKDAPTTFQKEAKEVEENTIRRRTQTAVNPIIERSNQRLGCKRVSKEPIRRKPNHNRIENMERAAQRLVSYTGSDFTKTCLMMKSEIVDSKKRNDPNCRAKNFIAMVKAAHKYGKYNN